MNAQREKYLSIIKVSVTNALQDAELAHWIKTCLIYQRILFALLVLKAQIF
jgi:hypothetical protein